MNNKILYILTVLLLCGCATGQNSQVNINTDKQCKINEEVINEKLL